MGLDLSLQQALLGVHIALDDLLPQGLEDHVPAGGVHQPQNFGGLDDSQEISELIGKVPGEAVDVLAPAVIVQNLQETQNPGHPHFRHRCDLHSRFPFLGSGFPAVRR